MKKSALTKSISFNDFKKEILNDYKTILISREASLLGRKEVLSGKAKFGIFGDGKELPQIAMAKVLHFNQLKISEIKNFAIENNIEIRN